MTPTRVHLLEVDPDLAVFLSPDEREVAGRLTAPMIELPAGALSLAELAELDEIVDAINGLAALTGLEAVDDDRADSAGSSQHDADLIL